MPDEDNLKKEVKDPVKDLVKEITAAVFYELSKTGTKRAVNELKKELRDKLFRNLRHKVGDLSEQQLGQLLDEVIEQLPEEFVRSSAGREALLRQIEEKFRTGLKQKLLGLVRTPWVRIVTISTVSVLVIIAGVLIWALAFNNASPSIPPDNNNTTGPVITPPVTTDSSPPPETIPDTIPPEVAVRFNPPQPEAGQTITVIAEAGDNVGIDWMELLVNGEIVAEGDSPPLTFDMGPFRGGEEFTIEAFAYDAEGNQGYSGPRVLIIPVSQPPPDTTPPEVVISHSPLNPGPNDIVTFTVEAGDNVGVSLIVLNINGQIAARGTDPPLVFQAGPFGENTTTNYSASVYDEAGNVGTAKNSFVIPLQ